MIEVAIMRVRPEQVERLRGWLAELMVRGDEVRETFANEGVTDERGYLLTTADGPLLIYAMEAQDHEKASQAYQHSTLPIDKQHREVMREVLAGPAAAELLYEMKR